MHRLIFMSVAGCWYCIAMGKIVLRGHRYWYYLSD